MAKRPKVLVLLGSPRRRGNSAVLAEHIAQGAKRKGATVTTVFLHGRRIEPCRGCRACGRRNARGCVIQDDMQPLYRQMLAADAWVIASPVYWFTMSAQVKLWMDRCLALSAYGKDSYAGKRIAIAMTYGGADPFDSGCVNALRTFQDAYRYAGAEIVGMVYGSADTAGEIRKDRTVMRSAAELGAALIG